jgi:peptidoglycan hydrolase CwlO-like protein
MKKILSAILMCCLIFSCGEWGRQEPLLKDEIEDLEVPAEEQQKADAPFLSLNKTGTAILAVSIISIIGVLAWKLILARRKITADKEIYKERDRQFEDMRIENQELAKRPTPEATEELQSQLGKADEDIANLRGQLGQKVLELTDIQGQLGIKQGELEEKGREVTGLHEYAETREKQWEDVRTQWQQDLDKMVADLSALQSDRDQQWTRAEAVAQRVKKLEILLARALDVGEVDPEEVDATFARYLIRIRPEEEGRMSLITEEVVAALAEIEKSCPTKAAVLSKFLKENDDNIDNWLVNLKYYAQCILREDDPLPKFHKNFFLMLANLKDFRSVPSPFIIFKANEKNAEIYPGLLILRLKEKE